MSGIMGTIVGRSSLVLGIFSVIVYGVHRPVQLCGTDSSYVSKIVTQGQDAVYDSFDDSVIFSKTPARMMNFSAQPLNETGWHSNHTCNITDFKPTLHEGETTTPSQSREALSKRVLAHRNLAVGDTIRVFSQVREQNVHTVKHQTLTEFTLTAYSLDVRSTGKTKQSADYGITFSGTQATIGRTVAVDPNLIPIGTPVYIDLKGIGWRIAEDTGGAVQGRHIDLLLASEAAAVRFGVKRHIRVYIPDIEPIQAMVQSPGKF